MKLHFRKMHGLGNDFIMIDDRNEEIANHISYSELAKKLCNRNFAVGADGLIVVLNSKIADIKYRIFNPDGSEPQMCGNGIRCYAKYVYDNRIIAKESFVVETLAGPIIPKVNLDEDGEVDTVRVDMGEPILEPVKIPFNSDLEKAIDEEIDVDGQKVRITAVSMGNPHCVIFVDKIDNSVVRTLGPKIEKHERFPQKTNVEFAEIVAEDDIIMRVWERGAGETLACGTGSCATLVAANLNGKSGNKAMIHLAGGDLYIEWDKSNNHIFMTGSARNVFDGVLEIK